MKKKIKVPIRKRREELTFGRSRSTINYNTFSCITEYKYSSSSGISSELLSDSGFNHDKTLLGYGYDTCFVNGKYASKLER